MATASAPTAPVAAWWRPAAFAALMAGALSLGPPLAHLFALPNKIGMDAETYFAAQAAYRGWNLTAFLILAQVVAFAALAVALRRDRPALRLVLAAIGCVIAAQAIFWAFTFPANVATGQWTETPGDWAAQKERWEYSHAAGAAFQIGAMAFAAAGVLRASRPLSP